VSKWKRSKAGIYVRDSYIKRVDIGPSGKPLFYHRRPYKGPWALATGDPWIEEEHYAFYDEGTESGSSIIGTADNQQTLTTGQNYQVRFCIANTGTYGYKNMDIQFMYNHEGGGDTPITTSSSVIRAYDSASLTQGGDCTARLTGTGTFHADNDGVCEDGVTCGGSNLDVSQGYYFNVLLSFTLLGPGVTDGDQIYIIPVFDSATPTYLDQYAHTGGANLLVYKPATARRIFIT